MSTSAGPLFASKENLIYSMDPANTKSFRGKLGTNLLTRINPRADLTATYFTSATGTEIVDIPNVGTVNCKYVDIYNDYPNSGSCCPNLFDFGFSVPVTGDTQYTYQIIYKTTTGYSHANYMYRYEYDAASSLQTEAGVHTTANRILLGDGWYMAWGSFTTRTATTKLNTYLFHYQYAQGARVYVAGVMLTQGSYVYPAQHFLVPTGGRGNTIASNGGIINLLDQSINVGEIWTNAASFSSENLGVFSTDGLDDYIPINVSSRLSWTQDGSVGNTSMSIDFWVKSTDTSGYFISKPWNGNGQYNYYVSSGSLVVGAGASSSQLNFASGISDGTWKNVVVWMSPTEIGYYINGNQYSGSKIHNITGGIPVDGHTVFNLVLMSLYPYGSWAGNASFSIAGNLGPVKAYNKVLSATEVVQNFNATRRRFGI